MLRIMKLLQMKRIKRNINLRSLTIPITTLILLCGAASTDVLARMPDSTNEVVRIVKKSGFLPANSRVSARLARDNTIIVSTYSKPTNSDKNLIIDSVLISKSIIDEFADVNSIRCIFYNPYNVKSYRHVTVPRNIVLKYGKGELSKTQLIESLTLGRSQIRTKHSAYNSNLSSYVPKEEMLQTQRGMMLVKMRQLKNAGRDTTQFFKQFMEIEKNYVAKGKRNEANKYLASLDKNLDTAIRETQLKINLKHSQQKKLAGGMYVERRNFVLDKINQLASNGKDVSNLMKVYDQTVTPYVNNPKKMRELDQALSILEHKLKYMR